MVQANVCHRFMYMHGERAGGKALDNAEAVVPVVGSSFFHLRQLAPFEGSG